MGSSLLSPGVINRSKLSRRYLLFDFSEPWHVTHFRLRTGAMSSLKLTSSGVRVEPVCACSAATQPLSKKGNCTAHIVPEAMILRPLWTKKIKDIEEILPQFARNVKENFLPVPTPR